MAVPTDMDGFSEKIGNTDTYSRLSLGDALLSYLGNNYNSIECNDIGQFIDKLVPWLTCSNYKVIVCFFCLYHFFLNYHWNEINCTSLKNVLLTGCPKRTRNNDCFDRENER